MAGGRAASAYDWLPPTNKIVLLAVSAHPDDEGIRFGGALPYYSTVLNLPTMLVCMADAYNSTRQGELRCAAWTYGLRYEPIFGHFDDHNTGTYTNTPYGTNTMDMCWDLWADGVLQWDGSDVEAGKARAINFVAEQIRRYRPDVIVTHDLNGESGHDNHKATAYAVTRAFEVAADPNATAANLIGLPPWQAQKLYVHLYPTNRLFHEFWEAPCAALANQTAHQVVNTGLTCHVSQGPTRWLCGSVYPPVGQHAAWPGEWWGLYASMVGPDTVLSSNLMIKGYQVPSGVAAGNFLEHVSLDPAYPLPVFGTQPLLLPTGATYDPYTGVTLADYVIGQAPPTLTFTKISGPDWLSVAADGSLSGTPSAADEGTNTWVIGATDGNGATAQATVSLFLIGRPVGRENLMGWWKLTETNPASPVAANSAPLSPDGVPAGGVTFGLPGARPWTRVAAQFDGTSGKIDVPCRASLNPPVFTAALWAQVIGGSGTYRSPLTSRKSAPQAGYMFHAAINNVWQFRIGNGSTWNILSAGPVETNTWTHLAATYDGTTACFYTNGVLAAAMNVGFRPNDAFPLRIGSGASEGPGAYWFPGLIDDVRIYRVALDAVHVRALYAEPPLVRNLIVTGDGTVQVQGSGIAGYTYVLLAAANRVAGATWTPVATNVVDGNGQILFSDSEAVNYAQRFYRIALP